MNKVYYNIKTPTGKTVRTFGENGVTYYSASDIARVFNHSNSANVMYHVPDTEALQSREYHRGMRACWYMTTKGLLAYLAECSHRNPEDAAWLKKEVLVENRASGHSQKEEKIEAEKEHFTVVRCCEEYLVICGQEKPFAFAKAFNLSDAELICRLLNDNYHG